MRTKNGGYRGRGDVEIHREYICNPDTGELVLFDNAPEGSDDWELVEVTFTFTGYSWRDPGRTLGRPEDCYPPEGETEIEEWTCSHEGFEPTQEERKEALNMIRENAASGEFDDDPDPPEDHYDYNGYYDP